jgi:hypothetical protein
VESTSVEENTQENKDLKPKRSTVLRFIKQYDRTPRQTSVKYAKEIV